MLDGARNALLGYLYQLLGTASLRVREVRPGNDAWAELIARVGDGVLRCEEFSQDATVRPSGLPDQGAVAIQFKHSAAGSAIDRPELIDILYRFDQARAEASARGVTLSRYALITNRTLHANAEALLEEARTSPDPPDALRLRTTRAGSPIAENVSRLEHYGGDANTAARAWHDVLKALDVPPVATYEGDLERLRKFAARYGVLDHEWDARLNALVGALVRETAEDRAVDVTPEWLKGHLVGDQDAANLQFGSPYTPHISGACRTRLDERIALQHRIPEPTWLPREAQREIEDQLALHPVVFVYGDGGCGKSLAVSQYLRSAWGRQLVWTEPAATATETTIVAAITDGRLPARLTGGMDRTFSDIRARLNVANPGQRQLWTIDLDGIDEAPDRRAELRHLINLCWAGGRRERSPASVVVTCRSHGGARPRDQLLSEWIATPEPDLVDGVGFVSVGEFTEQDLVQAARLLSGQPEERIVYALEPGAGGGRAGRFPDMEPIAPDTLRALQHPVVWGGYASMGEEDRTGVLDGSQVCLGRLAARLIQRFLLRCNGRRRWSDPLMLDRALRAAARDITTPPPHEIQDWERGCHPYLAGVEARDLYHESLTYGFVRRESSGRWRWGHLFVVDYLASLGEG